MRAAAPPPPPARPRIDRATFVLMVVGALAGASTIAACAVGAKDDFEADALDAGTRPPRPQSERDASPTDAARSTDAQSAEGSANVWVDGGEAGPASDASAEDAKSKDSGAKDGAADGSPRDAALDARATDASREDAAARDASPTDASGEDASTSDAGPDAAGPDAAPPADAGGPCLVVSEYVEGSASHKAVEIWNCGAAPVALDAFGLCLQSNTTTSGCTFASMLRGTLAANGVVTVCAPQFSHAACTWKDGVVNFNGDDRIALLHDDDGDGTVDLPADSVVDSFGALGAAPSGEPWADKTFRRATCTPYKGSGPFALATLYTAASNDDLSDLGKPPSLTCP